MDRRTVLTGTASAAALILAGPALAQSVQGVSDTEIVVGTHLDLSGPVAAGMTFIRNGMSMRLDELNEAGGIHGRKIKLIVEDNGYQPAQAVRATQKLVRQDKVFAIINVFGTGTALASFKGAIDAGAVFFAPWAASAPFHGAKSPLVFTTVPNYDLTTAIGLSWAIKEFKATKVGLIYQGDAFGELLMKGYKEALAAHGLTSAGEASYKPGDVDFSAQVARMRNAGAEVIQLATITRETIGVMAEVKKIGWTNVKVVAAVPGRTQIVARLGKEAVEGLYGIGVWNIHYPDTAPDPVKKWWDAYKKKFNGDPDENAMVAYSYTDWFVKGLQAAGRNLNAEAFAKAIQGVEHQDIFGNPKVKFTNNHIDPTVVWVEQLKGGRWSPASPRLTTIVK